jgi:tRNA 2-thiouridine synthesizing protein A
MAFARRAAARAATVAIERMNTKEIVMTDTTARLDARGMNCPLPILKTQQALKRLRSGEMLEVTSTDSGSMGDMVAFCEQTGHELVSSGEDVGEYIFLIRK